MFNIFWEIFKEIKQKHAKWLVWTLDFFRETFVAAQWDFYVLQSCLRLSSCHDGVDCTGNGKKSCYKKTISACYWCPVTASIVQGMGRRAVIQKQSLNAIGAHRRYKSLRRFLHISQRTKQGSVWKPCCILIKMSSKVSRAVEFQTLKSHCAATKVSWHK